MAASRPALVFALAALLAAPGLAAGQPAGPRPPAVVRIADSLVVDLACAGSGPLSASIDEGEPQPVTVTPAPGPALALALLIDVTPAMGEAGTPHSTRLADVVFLATALLDRVPPGSRVSVVTFDTTATTVLPLSEDPGAARRALTNLAPRTGLTASEPYALFDALRLAGAELGSAPPGPRAAFVFAGAPGFAPGEAALRTALAPDTRLTLVGLAPELASTANDNFLFLPFHTTNSATLPTLVAAYDRHVAGLIGDGLTRLQVPAGDLAAGPHQLRIVGCGEPVAVTFEAGSRLSVPLVAGTLAAVLVVGVAGYGLWRHLGFRDVGATTRFSTARYRPSSRVTTARRPGAVQEQPRLSAVVWDGRERRVYPLVGRQYTVGREAGCEIRIESEWVSGLHARITLVGDGAEIADLGSTNGTFVGDAERLVVGAPARLVAGDVVLIGPEVRLAIQGAEEPGDEELL